MRIEPGDLAVFLAIARRRSFRRAALDLGVTPSALSHALRALEERVGVRLVNRTTRSVALTEAGQLLSDRIEPAFRDIEGALDALAEFRGAPMGSLRLNAADTAARLVLMPLVAGFLEAHRAVNLEIVAQGAMVDVVAEGFDAGVRFGETIAADMIAVPIGPRRQRYVAAAAPAYLKAHGRPRHPKDLLGHACIRHRFSSGAMPPWEFERGGKVLRIAPRGPLVASAAEFEIEAACAGLGVIYTFEEFLAPALRARRLVPILEEWWQGFSGPYLYYAGRRLMPAPLRAFVDFIKARPDAGHPRGA